VSVTIAGEKNLREQNQGEMAVGDPAANAGVQEVALDLVDTQDTLLDDLLAEDNRRVIGTDREILERRRVIR